jgi:hypothetical protein
MKKSLSLLLTFGTFFATGHVSAQFRSIPGIVTDSFKVRYPNAKSVNWSDKISNFQATFMLDTSKYTAKYGSKGEWMGSSKRINEDALPASVKDGLSKSMYAGGEWKVRMAIMYYLPGNINQYVVQVAKSDFQKKNLLFNSDGQMLKDNSTL